MHGLSLTAIDNPSSFYEEARAQLVCAECGQGGTFEAHHVVEKRRCKVERFPLHSPDNALRLCAKAPERCHERHTSAQERVQLASLRDENIAFARHWLGAGAAYEYLVRYYDGRDERVEALKWESQGAEAA